MNDGQWNLWRAERAEMESIKAVAEARIIESKLMKLAHMKRELAVAKKRVDDEIAEMEQTLSATKRKLATIEKASTKRAGRSDQEKLLIQALHSHHKIDGQSVGNSRPLGVNELHRLFGEGTRPIAKGTISEFFRRRFGGHKRYTAACGEGKGLIAVLTTLAGEVDTRRLIGGK